MKNILKLIDILYSKIKTSNIAHRMATGAFWSLTGTSIAKFLVLAAGIICARILGKEEYGEFGMIRSTINMFVVFGMSGLGLTATKFISEYRKSETFRIPSIYILTNGFALITGIVITVSILGLAPIIATKNLNSPYLINDLRWGALILFFTVLNGVQSGTLSGMENFKAIAVNTLIGSITEAILMILGAYYFGVTGALIGYGFGYIVFAVCNQISIRETFKKFGIGISLAQFKRQDLKLLYSFSIPAALSSLMVAPVYWYIRSLLVRTNGYGELAIYEASDQWKVIILFVPMAISQIVLPILSSISSTDSNKFWKVLRINIFVNASISFIMALFVCLFAKYIMSLYGSDFEDTTTLIILAISTIFSSIANVIGISISSRNKMWIGFMFNVCWAIMVILFSSYFIKQNMGASGLAWAILYSYAIHSFLQFIYLKITTK